jgi:hypothetical protein
MLSNYSIGRIDSACLLCRGCVLYAIFTVLGCGEIDPRLRYVCFILFVLCHKILKK